MTKKRPVSDVRRELRELESEVTHLVIQNFNSEKHTERIAAIRSRIDELNAAWPKAKQGPRTK